MIILEFKSVISDGFVYVSHRQSGPNCIFNVINARHRFSKFSFLRG